MQRRVPYLLVWTSFYEQLAWSPMMLVLATAAGDPGVIALAASAYSAANLGGNLLFGYLSDQASRFLVAGVGLAAMAVTALLHLYAPAPEALVGARFFHGLAAAAVAPAALAAVLQGVPPDRRGERMARVGIVIAFASMLSPAISGRLASGLGVGSSVGFLVVGLLLVSALSLRAALLDRPPAAQISWPGESESLERPEATLNPALALGASLVAFVVMFMQNTLFYALPLRGAEFGMGPGQVGPLLSAFAVGSILAFTPPVARLSDRLGRPLPIMAGLLISAGGMGGLAVATTAPAMAVALFAHGIGFGLVFPAVSALSGDASGPRRRGMAYGILTAAFSAGAVAGPLVTQALSGLYHPFAVASFVAAAGGALVGLGILLYRPSGLGRSY